MRNRAANLGKMWKIHRKTDRIYQVALPIIVKVDNYIMGK